MKTIERLETNVAAGKGLRLSSDEAESLKNAISESRTVIDALREQKENPTLVRCPKCDQWGKSRKSRYICLTCEPNVNASPRGQWQDPLPASYSGRASVSAPITPEITPEDLDFSHPDMMEDISPFEVADDSDDCGTDDCDIPVGSLSMTINR